MAGFQDGRIGCLNTQMLTSSMVSSHCSESPNAPTSQAAWSFPQNTPGWAQDLVIKPFIPGPVGPLGLGPVLQLEASVLPHVTTPSL